MTRFKQYIDETVVSSNIARYDKKIGDRGNTKMDFLELVIKNEEFMEKINQVADKYGLSVTRNGNRVKLEGSPEKIRQAEEDLKAAGVE